MEILLTGLAPCIIIQIFVVTLASLPYLESIMRDNAFKASSDSGFSLLEVLAVIVIIGILGALAAPGWIGFLNRQHARDARDQLQQAIRTTQTDAKRLRRRRSIQFYDAANSTADGVPQIELNNSGLRETIGRGELSDGSIDLQVFDANGNAVNQLIFEADGSLSVDANSFTYPLTVSFEAPAGGNLKRCLQIETILAAIDTEKNAACN